MSIELMARVWKIELSHSQQAVLLAMADFANDDGRNCYPSHKRLAWKTGYSERQISRLINELIELGIIKVIKLGTNNQPPRYWIRINKGKAKKPFDAESIDGEEDGDDILSPLDIRGDILSPQSNSESGSRGDILSPPSVAFVIPRGDRMSPDPSVNHHSVCLIDPIPDPVDVEDQSNNQTTKQPDASARDDHDLAEMLLIEVGVAPATAQKLALLGLDLVQRAVAAWYTERKDAGGKLDNKPGIVVYWLSNPEKAGIPPKLPAAWAYSALGKSFAAYNVRSETPEEVDFMPNTHPVAPSPPTALAPPMSHDDPWAVALAELSPTLVGVAASWLVGSQLQESGELAGVPLYRVLVTNSAANVTWLTQQAEPAIRKKLSSLFGKRILVEIVAATEPELAK